MYLFPETIVWILLCSAIVAIACNKKIWVGLLAGSLLMGSLLALIEPIGLIITLTGIALAYLGRAKQGYPRYLLHGALIIWALLLAAHIMPGFNNLKVIENATSGANSLPFSMYLNLDKPMLIFALILLVPGMLSQKPAGEAKNLWLASTITLISLPLAGYFLGVIKPEISLPSWLGLFALNNLLLTCAAEEVFFRGYLIHLLKGFGKPLALTISSLLFGLAHFAGGIELILLATIAGGCYGAIYLASGRLYIAVIAHFLFNMYHLVFYTYPMAASS